MEARPRTGKRRFRAIALGTAMACALLGFASGASAAAPALLFSVPVSGVSGSGAGQFDNPRGVAVNPVDGHIFVGGGNNHRIDEFTAQGEFVKAWGWGVADGTSAQLQTCSTTCFKGLSGSGAGQFNFARSVAVDESEHVYVFELQNRRVQKFDKDGNFLLMFGGEVNKTTGADICTKANLEAAQQCGAGILGTGPSEFSTGAVGNYIAVGPDGNIYVGDKGRIQRFDPSGTFLGEIQLTGELAGKTVQQLDIDSSGNFYAVFNEFATAAQNNRVWKLGPAGEELDPKTFAAINAGAVAVDVDNNLFVVEDPPGFGSPATHARVLKYDPAASKLIPTKAEEENDEFFAQPSGNNIALQGLATDFCPEGERALYVTDRGGRLRAFGEPLKCRDPEPPKPSIEAQYASSVGTESAVLKAEINPRFAASTTYYLRYGLQDCNVGPCTDVPAPPGLPLGNSGGAAVPTAGIPIAGLTPGTTYHFRFVAISGAETVEGPDETFTTFRPVPDPFLPDGRAYEMVSPQFKNSAELAPRGRTTGGQMQASPSGDAVSYISGTAFGEAKSAPALSQYLSRRGPSGWSTDNITPPDQTGTLENAVRGFFTDLSTTALIVREPPLCCDAPAGLDNLYLRDNADGSLTLLTAGEPRLTIPRSDYCVAYGGASSDGSRVVFAAQGALTPDAPEGQGFSLYQWSEGGGLDLVSVLPGEVPAAPNQFTGFGAGMADGCRMGRRIVRNAISADGSKIFWTLGGGSGGLFARVDGTQTVQLDLPQGGSGPAGTGVFWAASADGSRVLFTASGKLTPGAQTGDLYLYDFGQPLGIRLTNLTAGPSPAEMRGLVGASESGDSAYFVAKAVLASNDGAAIEPDGNVQKAKAGENNVYFWQQGQPLRFVASLAPGEADQASWTLGPEFRTARVAPDGEHLAFLTARPLTGYENIDQATGKAVNQAYVYDATAHELRCASCNPSGARPLGPSALTAWTLPFEQARFLSDGGERLFFESFDSLEPRDVNGKRDVYEFERAGVGDCDEESPTYSAATDACVSLISTGKSSSESYFVDASASGDDVFLSTRQRLTATDIDDYYDVYDARVGGGFPDPPPPIPPCGGEACREAGGAPPTPQSPVTPSFVGPSDPIPARCRKGKVMRKGKCVKKPRKAKPRHRKGHRKAAHRGRQGR
jgi:hypothetical protein